MMIETLYAYSYLPNKRTCPFILFKEKILPTIIIIFLPMYLFLSVCLYPTCLFEPTHLLENLRVHPVNIHMRFFLFQI